MYWSRWTPSILSWPQSVHASSAARLSQWRYTARVKRKRATASTLPQVPWDRTYSGYCFPGLSKALGFLGRGSTFVNVCRRFSSLLGFLFGSLITDYFNMT
ncbi:hypothetical protein TNCV_2541461 [Trichonephila clavipes]|nr:hypothetical protein TNCV_2541461 [Trichonephila clavipes]